MRSLRSILAAALLVLMMGLPACGGDDGVVTHSARQPDDAPGLPNATVAAIRVCASHAEHRKGDVYAFQFNVEVTESGHVDRVRLKDSYPRNTGLESCLAGALERMQIPPFAVQKLLQRAGAVSPESRGLIGNPLLLVLVLLESTVVVDEATFMVALTVAAAADVVEAVKRRRARKKMCWDKYQQCLSFRKQPERNRGDYGEYKDCVSCLQECQEHSRDGKWPEYKCPSPD